MLRNRLQQKASRRGAATVEFALVVPLLTSILMFSIFLTEIILAKIKLQEASRYVAWEMTSYALSDYGEADHDKAFTTAMQATVEEANERYKDYNSLEPNGGSYAIMLRPSPVEVSITNQAVQGIDLSWVMPSGGAGEEVSSAIGKGYNFFLNHFKFNTKGQVQVQVNSSLASLLLPRRYLQRESRGFYSVDNWGGRDLSNLPIGNRYTLIANGWHLPDGGDALVKPKRAGVHDGGSEHGMFRQVGRMKFLGISGYLDKVGLGRISQVTNFFLPDFMGTFVVAHNYTAGTGGQDCNTPSHPAHPGLQNVNKYPGLDDERQRCFDTAPFRDTSAYASSLYIKIFESRGEHFMGCKNQMADMPNTPAMDPSTNKDKNKNKITCE